MAITFLLSQLYCQAKQNRWMRYFTGFNRVALALGFLPSGYVKIAGERFTSLSNNHPMGHYLEALFHTGYYYTFIGVAQMTAAILLLIPRTALLGAMLYFPIILNICILSFSVRFDGSLVSSPLMVLANLYLLCWDYDRLKGILLPDPRTVLVNRSKGVSNEFPLAFFGGGLITVVTVGFTVLNLFDMKPYNTLNDCQQNCRDSRNPAACAEFCDCIHQQGQPLNRCLDAYNRAVAAQPNGTWVAPRK
ncbi:DoxX family protein [Rudanella paleaurantiibacter]|nr:DoxX family protein [Rudanella paleaurantiibacter]